MHLRAHAWCRAARACCLHLRGGGARHAAHTTSYLLPTTTHYVPPATYSLLSTQVRFMLPTSDFREAGEARVQLSLNGQQFDGGEPLSFQYHHAVQCTLM